MVGGRRSYVVNESKGECLLCGHQLFCDFLAKVPDSTLGVRSFFLGVGSQVQILEKKEMEIVCVCRLRIEERDGTKSGVATEKSK